MEILVNNISDIVVAEVNTINDKIKGLNFLETLKVNVIEKCLPLIIKQKFPNEQNLDFEKNIEKNILISAKYFTESLSISKKTIEYDSLFISFNEPANFDIYQDDKKFKSIVLNKNNGISLPKNSVVNFKYKKNILLLEIQNKNIQQALTK
jgi:hypothetical protein